MGDLVEMDDLIDDVLVDLSEEDIVDLTASTTTSTAKTTTQHFRGDPRSPLSPFKIRSYNKKIILSTLWVRCPKFDWGRGRGSTKTRRLLSILFVIQFHCLSLDDIRRREV